MRIVSLVFALSACSLYINEGQAPRGGPVEDAAAPSFDGGIDPPPDGCKGPAPDAAEPWPDAAVFPDGGCESPPDALPDAWWPDVDAATPDAKY